MPFLSTACFAKPLNEVNPAQVLARNPRESFETVQLHNTILPACATIELQTTSAKLGFMVSLKKNTIGILPR